MGSPSENIVWEYPLVVLQTLCDDLVVDWDGAPSRQ
jgi:hypothetical protein